MPLAGERTSHTARERRARIVVPEVQAIQQNEHPPHLICPQPGARTSADRRRFSFGARPPSPRARAIPVRWFAEADLRLFAWRRGKRWFKGGSVGEMHQLRRKERPDGRSLLAGGALLACVSHKEQSASLALRPLPRPAAANRQRFPTSSRWSLVACGHGRVGMPSL